MFFLQDIKDENRKKLVAAIEDFCRSNGLNEIQIPFADSTMETNMLFYIIQWVFLL